MAKNLRTCAICSEEYDYCSSCPEKMSAPLWKRSFCSQNCKEIYDICVQFNLGQMSKSEAKKKLASCDLSKMDSFSEATKNAIEKINEKPKPKAVKKPEPAEDKPAE